MSGAVTAGALMVLVACGVVVVSMSGIASAAGAGGGGSNGDSGGNGVSFSQRNFVVEVGTACAHCTLCSLTSRSCFASAFAKDIAASGWSEWPLRQHLLHKRNAPRNIRLLAPMVRLSALRFVYVTHETHTLVRTAGAILLMVSSP